MKLFTKYIFTAVLVLGAVACHKDSGNYDYTAEAKAITISNDMRSNPTDQTKNAFVFKFGEEIVIPLKYTIDDPTLTKEDLSFEWYFGEEVVSTEEELRLPAMETNRYTGIVVILDNRNGAKYMSEYNFQVTDIFDTGWAIAVEKDDRTEIAVLEIDPNDGKYILKTDLYAQYNEGETLSKDLTGFDYHMYDTYPQVFGISVSAGGKSIELDSYNMTKLGRLNEQFVSDVDVRIKDAAYMDSAVYALTEDGDIFSRAHGTYGGDVIPHTGYFPSYPMTIETGVKFSHLLSGAKISNMMSAFSDSFAYDELNHRLVVVKNKKLYPMTFEEFFNNAVEDHLFDNGFDGINTYEDITYPLPEDLSAYNVKGIYGTGYDIDFLLDNKFICLALVLERKSDKKAFFYTLNVWDGYGGTDVDLSLFFPVPEDYNFDADTFKAISTIGGPDTILYFTANGNRDLYYLDVMTGAKGKIFSSESPISGFGAGQVQDATWLFGGAFTPYYEKMIIGTEDGKITVCQNDMASRIGGSLPVIKTMNLESGKLVRAIFMPASSVAV